MIKNGKNHSATYHDQNKKVFPKSRNDSRTLNWVIESLWTRSLKFEDIGKY